eukprot:TRINITY_DN2665_c0_g1_i1.p1 TRINITY_DN2665_c0_g1~~TRINITY_DN2665_c0_g1_i1.p1  ORF type:complete len:414 (+),score=80.92 TRINITY_DN2665_c0_g1_i1:478-1719(+)
MTDETPLSRRPTTIMTGDDSPALSKIILSSPRALSSSTAETSSAQSKSGSKLKKKKKGSKPLVELSENDLLSSNVCDLYHGTKLVYNLVASECTDDRCPIMSAGRVEHYWTLDGSAPVKLSAKQYITKFEEWVEKQLSDPSVFPDNGQYSVDFKSRVQQILKKMARVYTHIYCHHLQKIQDIGADKEINSHFKRFYTFVKEYNLVEDQEFEPVYFILWKLENEAKKSIKIRTPFRNDALNNIACPPEENLNEWIAAGVIELAKTAGLMFCLVVAECTKERCPVMCAGPKIQYYWADGVKIKKPIKVSAPEYVQYLQTWITGQLNDPAIFPVDGESGVYPRDFIEQMKNMLKRLLRIYLHIYHHHLDKVVVSERMNFFMKYFKQFYYFTIEFKLVDEKEFEPLSPIISALKKRN